MTSWWKKKYRVLNYNNKIRTYAWKLRRLSNNINIGLKYIHRIREEEDIINICRNVNYWMYKMDGTLKNIDNMYEEYAEDYYILRHQLHILCIEDCEDEWLYVDMFDYNVNKNVLTCAK